MFQVDFYRKKDGTIPAQEFLDGLESGMKVKALNGIQMLKEYGNQVRGPYSKYIDSGIFELRILASGNIGRVFYFFQVGQRILLTNGYIKKAQKMDAREFERALAYKQDFERGESSERLR